MEKSEDISWVDQVNREFKDFRFNIISLLLRIQGFFLDLSSSVHLKYQNASE